jgi:hypothetical protein
MSSAPAEAEKAKQGLLQTAKTWGGMLAEQPLGIPIIIFIITISHNKCAIPSRAPTPAI